MAIQWQHIKLKLAKRKSDGEELWVTVVELTFCKGGKADGSKDLAVTFEILKDFKLFIFCPVKWLVIMAVFCIQSPSGARGDRCHERIRL